MTDIPRVVVFCLCAVSFSAGILVGDWRSSTTVDALRAENAELRRTRDALDKFVTLVIDDVERSVDRAGELLVASSEFVRPGKPTYPPTSFAGGRWWHFNVALGKWEPMGVEP